MLESELRLPVFKWLAGNNIPFRYEVPLPWGRADIVGVDRTSFEDPIDLNRFTGLSVPTRARILSVVNRFGAVGCPLDTIFTEFQNFIDREEILSHLDALQNRGLIRNIGLQTRPIRFISVGLRQRPRLISIELKLRRASEVVNQALRNQVFSALTYVALPTQQADYLANFHTDQIYRSGLGILAVQGCMCTVIKVAELRQTRDLALELQLLAHLRRVATQAHSTSELQQHVMH